MENIENLIGSAFGDTLTGDSADNRLEALAGDDTLEGGAGTDTYVFSTGHGSDTITDTDGKMTLRFENSDHMRTDFTSSSITKDSVDLVISVDKDTADGITDKITIKNAYLDEGRMIDDLAFTISISLTGFVINVVDFL